MQLQSDLLKLRMLFVHSASYELLAKCDVCMRLMLGAILVTFAFIDDAQPPP